MKALTDIAESHLWFWNKGIFFKFTVFSNCQRQVFFELNSNERKKMKALFENTGNVGWVRYMHEREKIIW
tara:strand:+ start:38 stop:247 length:210 start_codon:yes stop_codon:yes gene_type:complete